MAVEQGLSFTLIEAPDPLADASPAAIAAYDATKDFYSARRVWLGWVPGTDWLHDAIEGKFGEDQFWYEVKSERNAAHVGASAEIATVVVVLMGIGGIEFVRKFGSRLGEHSADAFYDWVKQLARRRREEKGLEWADPPPEFSTFDAGSLPESIKGELANVMNVRPERLELIATEQRQDLVMFARYRDTESGREYTAELGRADVLFKRFGAPEP